MRSLERFLIGLDDWPWSAIWRVALGGSILPVFRAIAGGWDSIWTSLVLFLGLLIALRLAPVVLRRALPFSPEAKEIWKQRRFIAKRYDSYQWQKLFWIGLGLLPYAFIGSGLRNGEMMLVTICLMGGGLGLFIWRKIRATEAAT